jgi:hypothetical protein
LIILLSPSPSIGGRGTWRPTLSSGTGEGHTTAK